MGQLRLGISADDEAPPIKNIALLKNMHSTFQ
jgi:hypothetical protein